MSWLPCDLTGAKRPRHEFLPLLLSPSADCCSRRLLKFCMQPPLLAPASLSTVTSTIGQLQTLKSGRICFLVRFLATSLTYPHWLAGYVIAAVSWSLSAAARTRRVGKVLASLSDRYVLTTSTKATDTLGTRSASFRDART